MVQASSDDLLGRLYRSVNVRALTIRVQVVELTSSTLVELTSSTLRGTTSSTRPHECDGME